MKIIYIIGSLRNTKIPHIGNSIREAGFEACDYWWSSGCHFCEHSADESWNFYRKIRGQNYRDAIYDYAAQNVVNFDMHHLKRADAGVVVMPGGKAAHLECGVLIGRNKPVYILFDGEPNDEYRPDLMHGAVTDIFFSVENLITTLRTL